MNEVRLVLVGFGNVGRAFARLMQRKSSFLESEYGLAWKITGIATGGHGMAIDPDGLDVDQALRPFHAGLGEGVGFVHEEVRDGQHDTQGPGLLQKVASIGHPVARPDDLGACGLDLGEGGVEPLFGVV